MSDLLKDIKNYLVNQAIESEENIKLDFSPDEPDNLIAIYEYGGEPGSGHDIDERRIQITVRNKSLLTAKTKINSIRNLLDDSSPEQIIDLNNREAVFAAIHTPFKLKEDNNKRHYYVCNFRVITVRD